MHTLCSRCQPPPLPVLSNPPHTANTVKQLQAFFPPLASCQHGQQGDAQGIRTALLRAAVGPPAQSAATAKTAGPACKSRECKAAGVCLLSCPQLALPTPLLPAEVHRHCRRDKTQAVSSSSPHSAPPRLLSFCHSTGGEEREGGSVKSCCLRSSPLSIGCGQETNQKKTEIKEPKITNQLLWGGATCGGLSGILFSTSKPPGKCPRECQDGHCRCNPVV